MTTPITVAYGDGIGPEIMEATLSILKEAGAKIDIQVIEIGEKVYQRGINSGIESSAWDSIKSTKVFLKSPITTPQGGGFKSLNVTVRKGLGLFANVRPCISYHPYVKTLHPGIDCVIVRENEEDLYAGIEYTQSEEVFHAIKLISKPGTERIIRYAFEYARAHNRKKVTCLTKDNILKITDGYFHRRFKEIALDYPEIAAEHYIIDIGTARLAVRPGSFDVIVTLNLYGDIISDVVAEVAGSVGMGGSANIGKLASMFEAIHGSAPDIAGKNLANPSGLLHAAIMMLVHIGQNQTANLVYNAWAKTIESGFHTGDVAQAGLTHEVLGTKAFTQKIISFLGESPEKIPVADFRAQTFLEKVLSQSKRYPSSGKKTFDGVDVYVDWTQGTPEALALLLKDAAAGMFTLKLISNRGLTAWPERAADTETVDAWRCRFMGTDQKNVAQLMVKLQAMNLDVIKHESLFRFNGERGYSQAQGE